MNGESSGMNGESHRSEAVLKVQRISAAISGNRLGAKIAAAALLWCAVAILSAPASSADTARDSSRQFHRDRQIETAIAPATRLAQAESADDDSDDKEIPPNQVDKYINVQVAMQKDHNLTVEQAASKQGMTLTQFRSLEGKIERDDTLRERVRKALRHAANPNDKESSDD